MIRTGLCRVRTSGRCQVRFPTISGRGLGVRAGSAWPRPGRGVCGPPGRCPCRAQAGAGETGEAPVNAQGAFVRPFETETVSRRTRGSAARATARHRPKVMLRPRVGSKPIRQYHTVAARDVARPGDRLRAGLARASSFNHTQSASRRRPHSPAWRGRPAASALAVKRLVNAQQNAHRCDPPGGDPGGGSARQPGRGIRLRVGQP